MENVQGWVKPEIILVAVDDTLDVPKFTDVAENASSHS